MLQRVRYILADLGFYGLWGILAAFAALAAYQAYITLIYVGLLAVENPSTRPAGWNTSTIHGLGRFLVLVLGILWLLLVSFLEGYLREGTRQRQTLAADRPRSDSVEPLRARVLRTVLFIGALYGISYSVLFLLSR
jgi:hypothetical protein